MKEEKDVPQSRMHYLLHIPLIQTAIIRKHDVDEANRKKKLAAMLGWYELRKMQIIRVHIVDFDFV